MGAWTALGGEWMHGQPWEAVLPCSTNTRVALQGVAPNGCQRVYPSPQPYSLLGSHHRASLSQGGHPHCPQSRKGTVSARSLTVAILCPNRETESKHHPAPLPYHRLLKGQGCRGGQGKQNQAAWRHLELPSRVQSKTAVSQCSFLVSYSGVAHVRARTSFNTSYQPNVHILFFVFCSFF